LLPSKVSTGKGDDTEYDYHFDGKELITEVTITDGKSESLGGKYTITCTKEGWPREIIGPKQSVVKTFEYDGVGRLKSSKFQSLDITAQNCKTDYTTDYFGQPVETRLPGGRIV